jgi:hypothetical protein
VKKCLSQTDVNTALGALHVIADFFLAIFPIPLIIKMQQPRSLRYLVIILLGLGMITAIAGMFAVIITSHITDRSKGSFDIISQS